VTGRDEGAHRDPDHLTAQWVAVHFLHESLGQDRVRVDGPYPTFQDAERRKFFSRADREVKVVKLERPFSSAFPPADPGPVHDSDGES
jgi:hypothetical protein